MNEVEEPVIGLSGHEQLEFIREILHLIREILRQKVVSKEVSLDQADEDKEFDQGRPEITIQWLPFLSLVLFLKSSHVLIVKLILEFFISLITILTLPILFRLGIQIVISTTLVRLLEP